MANEPYRLTQTGAEVQADLNDIEALGLATEETAGKMSAADKQKLDGLPSGAELEGSLGGKVDKVTGKGLSTNDFTNADKEQVEQAMPLAIQLLLNRTEDIDTIRSGAASGATAYQKPATGIPSTDLASAVQTSLGKADTAYQKPQTGIPATDLASGVIPTALSELSEDTTHRTVTDSEKNAWNETNIIHASVLAFPAAFSNYTREQALAAFGVTNEQFSLIIASVGVYRTLIGGATMAFTNGVFIQSWDANGITFRRLTFSTIGSDIVYSFSGPLYLANVQSDWGEDDSTKPSFIKNKPDLNMKADKVSSPTVGNFAGLDSYGNPTDSGSKAGDFATAAQGAKADTAYQKPSGGIPGTDLATGVIPIVPTISTDISTDGNDDTKTASPKAVKTYADTKYMKPQNGIPASDIAAGVIPDVSGKENTSNKVTSLSAQSTDTQYPSAKATYDAINPPVQSSKPAGGFEPNVLYELGTITGTVTFALAAGVSGRANHYYWTFDTGSTAPTITWPAGISWNGGSAPTINASKHYEVSILGGIACYMEV